MMTFPCRRESLRLITRPVMSAVRFMSGVDIVACRLRRTSLEEVSLQPIHRFRNTEKTSADRKPEFSKR